jgi:hypothetical protein
VEIREPATGREERIFRGAGIDTTLGANHFGGRRTETRPLGRRRLGNKASTIWKMLFGVNEGDDDPAAFLVTKKALQTLFGARSNRNGNQFQLSYSGRLLEANGNICSRLMIINLIF